MPSLIPDTAAFEKRLAGLPIVKHPADEVVLTAGSKTGRLLFLRSGAVEVIKDGETIANVSALGSVFGEQAVLLDQPHTADVRTLEQSELNMNRTVLVSVLAAIFLAGGAVAQILPTDRRIIPPRSIKLSAQQGHVIKENVKDMHIEQVPRKKEIRIGNKVPSDIGLHDFPPLVVEKVPKVKTYKFFITENQIVLVSPQKEIADIIK
jgi:CRP/FNR family transcriptional regulator, cyclic AMP receptor protein